MWDFELGLSKYKRGLRFSWTIKPYISICSYVAINICYYLNCLALMHGLEIKLFLLFEYKLSDAWT
jgi:hypothetical protein